MTQDSKPGQNGNFPLYISDIKGFAIFMMDVNGIITTWNEGCEQMKGFSPDDAIGSPFEILFPDFLREENFPKRELEIAQSEGRFEGENWRAKKNGELFWAHVVLTKVLDEDGEFIGFIKVTQDHTRKKQLEDEVNKKNADLLKMNKSLEIAKDKVKKDLESFIYTASHDLRTPISNMEGLLIELKDRSTTADTETTELINYLEMCVERLKKTIGELTEINKIQNSVQAEKVEVFIGDSIEEVSMILKDLIKVNNAVIELNLDDCPSINFSSKDLRIILYNLISNGIKYRSLDRPPKILISSKRIEGYSMISISDNGLGLEKVNQDKAFSMFKRFHDHVEGTGIGLYMVKQIVDNAGGRIELESEIDVGTTFKIFLPN